MEVPYIVNDWPKLRRTTMKLTTSGVSAASRSSKASGDYDRPRVNPG